MKHLHHDLIVQWAAGAIIQYYAGNNSGWVDCPDNKPEWSLYTAYRVKPSKRPDEIRYGKFEFRVASDFSPPLFCTPKMDIGYLNSLYTNPHGCNVKVVFEDDLEGDYKIKSIEYIG